MVHMSKGAGLNAKELMPTEVIVPRLEPISSDSFSITPRGRILAQQPHLSRKAQFLLENEITWI